MANDHRTVLLSILATLVAATIVFLATVVVSGGFALDLVRGYVLPLVISAFTLTVFWGILFAQQKGKLSWLVPVEPNKDDKAAKVRDGIIQVSRSDRSCLRDTTIHREFFWDRFTSSRTALFIWLVIIWKMTTITAFCAMLTVGIFAYLFRCLIAGTTLTRWQL